MRVQLGARALVRLVKRCFNNGNGSVAVPMAVGMMAIMAAVGSSVDMARLLRVRENLQLSLDSATMKAVVEKTADANTVGRASLEANLTANDINLATLQSSFNRVTAERVSATASLQVPLTFMALFGKEHVTVNATSVAAYGTTTKTTTVSAPGTNVCILLLQTSGTGLLVNSGANVQAPNCEVDVLSTGNPAATFNSGTSLNFKRVCIKGTNIINNGNSAPSTTQLGCATVSDPYATTLPVVDSSVCTYWSQNINSSTVTFSPGVYCGGINFNSQPTATFQPGLYVIKSGDWNVNGGTWTGTGVTFYFADSSKIQFNSGVKATLSAPTTGTYKNILFFESKRSSTSQWTFNDSPGHGLVGLLYLPNRDLVMNSGMTADADQLTLVANSLILNQTTWNINPHDATKIVNTLGPTGTTTTTTTVTRPYLAQ